MIICDAAMILFTFDLNHSQKFRPHRKKKKKSTSPYSFWRCSDLERDHDLLPWLCTKSGDLLSPRSQVLWGGPGALPPCALTELRVNYIQACRRSNVLLNLHPLPNPSPPSWTQQNMNHPHTCSLVIANSRKGEPGILATDNMCWPPPPPSLAATGYPTGRPAEQEHLKERFIETIWVFFKNLSNLCKKNRSFVELVKLILQNSVESFGGEERTLFQWFQPYLQGQMELSGRTHSTLSPWLQLHRRAEPWCCQGRRRQVPCPKVPKVT